MSIIEVLQEELNWLKDMCKNLENENNRLYNRINKLESIIKRNFIDTEEKDGEDEEKDGDEDEEDEEGPC